jgi:hypothetical protein
VALEAQKLGHGGIEQMAQLRDGLRLNRPMRYNEMIG